MGSELCSNETIGGAYHEYARKNFNTKIYLQSEGRGMTRYLKGSKPMIFKLKWERL